MQKDLLNILSTEFLRIASTIEHLEKTTMSQKDFDGLLSVKARVNIARNAVGDVLSEITNELHGLTVSHRLALEALNQQINFRTLPVEPIDLEPRFMVDFDVATNGDAFAYHRVVQNGYAILKTFLNYCAEYDEINDILHSKPLNVENWKAIETLLNTNGIYTYNSNSRFEIYAKLPEYLLDADAGVNGCEYKVFADALNYRYRVDFTLQPEGARYRAFYDCYDDAVNAGQLFMGGDFMPEGAESV